MPEDTVKSLRDLLFRVFGVRTSHRINPTGNTDIEDTVLPVLSANPRRLGFVVVNMGANTLWLAPDDHVANDYGFELLPNGGSINMIWNEEFEMLSLPWYGVSVADPGTHIFVMEIQVF
ncbi:hypothetical protein ES703_32300 [subsurface metagenome]